MPLLEEMMVESYGSCFYKMSYLAKRKMATLCRSIYYYYCYYYYYHAFTFLIDKCCPNVWELLAW